MVDSVTQRIEHLLPEQKDASSNLAGITEKQTDSKKYFARLINA